MIHMPRPQSSFYGFAIFMSSSSTSLEIKENSFKAWSAKNWKFHENHRQHWLQSAKEIVSDIGSYTEWISCDNNLPWEPRWVLRLSIKVRAEKSQSVNLHLEILCWCVLCHVRSQLTFLLVSRDVFRCSTFLVKRLSIPFWLVMILCCMRQIRIDRVEARPIIRAPLNSLRWLNVAFLIREEAAAKKVAKRNHFKYQKRMMHKFAHRTNEKSPWHNDNEFIARCNRCFLLLLVLQSNKSTNQIAACHKRREVGNWKLHVITALFASVVMGEGNRLRECGIWSS